VICVLIVAASLAARANLRDFLQAPGFAVVGTASDLASIDDALLDSAPDVILVDTSRESLGADRAELAGIAERSRVVLLADRPDQAQLARALREGVLAVLPREVSAQQLQAALRAVVAGLVVAHPGSVASLVPAPALQMSTPPPLAEPLTKREREVLQMLAAGLGNKEIAARLSISDHTAKFHVASILGKLGASTRTEAVAIAMRHGLILL